MKESLDSRFSTFGHSGSARLGECDYASSIIVHATVCAHHGAPFAADGIASMVCDNVEFYCNKLRFRLYGYCLMPDHLHVLQSPEESGVDVSRWMDLFKSYTTNRFMKVGGKPPLWQRSWHDHVCRESETAETVLRYIVDNPVRAGLVESWTEWKWTGVFIDI
jgi:REP element-mobilizing transposase RayT